jgi:hypothetical protein
MLMGTALKKKIFNQSLHIMQVILVCIGYKNEVLSGERYETDY